MRRVTVVFTVVLLPAALAGLALQACGADAGAPSSLTSAPALPGSGGEPLDLAAVVDDALDGLVADGIISAAQQETVVAALGEFEGGGPPQASPLPPASASGQVQAPPPQKAPGGRDVLGPVLDPLVEDGTLTTAQAEVISAAAAGALPQLPGARAPPSDDSGS